MVFYCSAYGCTNLQDHRHLPFHSFPFKRPEILELWIRAVCRKDWAPNKFSKLCGEHFLPSDYQVRPGVTARLLKPNAVPSVFSFPKHVSPEENTGSCKNMKKLDLEQFAENEKKKSSNTQLESNNCEEEVVENLIIFEDIDSSLSETCKEKTLVDCKTQTNTKSQNTDIETPQNTQLESNNSKEEVLENFITFEHIDSSLSETCKEKTFVDCATQTNTKPGVTDIELKKLRRKIRTFRQKLKRRDETIFKMKVHLWNMKHAKSEQLKIEIIEN